MPTPTPTGATRGNSDRGTSDSAPTPTPAPTGATRGAGRDRGASDPEPAPTRATRDIGDRGTSAAIAVALVALVAWSIAQRWHVLAASPFPIGVDGYFYPIELRGLLAHGALPYAASPLTFWLFAPLAALTDPVTGAKLGAAIGGALIALPAYAVGARLAHNRGAGLLAAALATGSAGSMFLTIEFVKNGVGLTVATTAIWLALRALERATLARIAAAAAAIAATALVHKMAAGIVLAIVVPAAIAELYARRATIPPRTLTRIAAAAVAIVAILVVLGALAPRRFVSAADLALLSGLLTTHATWSAPALELPRATLAMGHEALLAGLIALIALAASLYPRRISAHAAVDQRPADRAAAIAILVLGVAIAVPWLRVDDPQGLGFRLRLIAFVPMALGAAIAARFLLAALGARTRTLVLSAAALAVVAIIQLARPTADAPDGEIVTHPALVTAALALDGLIPAGDTVIIPERHILFMVAWYAGVQVALRPDDVPRAHRWRLMPLAFIGAGSPLDHALMDARREPELEPPIGLHPRHPNGLVLVSEPTWEWVLTRLPAATRAHFEAWPTI